MGSAFFRYKNRPLVRSGDMIYYGSMADPYVAMIEIKQKKPFEDLTMATAVTVRLIDTDESKSLLERIVKSGDRSSLYEALDLADTWLTTQEKKTAKV